jgi:hypothetical protein
MPDDPLQDIRSALIGQQILYGKLDDFISKLTNEFSVTEER